MVLTDPWGLKVWKCTRPLDKKPGKKAPPVVNHQYNCVTLSNGSIKCDSTNAPPGWPQTGGPGVPSKSSDDYYDKNSCKEVDDDKDDCFERCLEKKWKKARPTYAIGPFGTDCQEYTNDTFEDCEKECLCSKKP